MPTSVDAYAVSGYIQLKQGQYDAAIADYDRAVALEPNSADRYRSRGYAHIKRGDVDLAIADYTKAIELSPAAGGGLCRPW